MQRTGKNVKKAVTGLVLLAVLIYASMCLFVYIFPPQYPKCERYNDELNGGTKMIGTVKYNVHMCGTGGDDNGNSDEVELKIISEQGELLAKRHFTVHWMANFHEPLEYRDGQIIYYDFSTQNNFKKTIAVPPTKIEWIRARLPFFS